MLTNEQIIEIVDQCIADAKTAKGAARDLEGAMSDAASEEAARKIKAATEAGLMDGGQPKGLVTLVEERLDDAGAKRDDDLEQELDDGYLLAALEDRRSVWWDEANDTARVESAEGTARILEELE